MINKTTRSILLSAISLLVILAFAYYLYVNADQYRQILRLSMSGVAMLFLLSLPFPLLNGLQNIYLYRGLGVDLSYQDGFLLTAASTLANQLPISGGIVSKGFYLKKIFNLPYTKFLSATLALMLCFLATNGVMGLSILLFWIFFKKAIVSPLLLIGFALMITCLLPFLLPMDRMRFPDPIRERIQQAVEGWNLISTNAMLLFKLVALQASLLLLLALRYWLAFHMLSLNVTFGEVMLFSAASILTQLVSIAPGGLGVREGIVGAVAVVLGFDMSVSIVAVGLDRLISTLPILLIGGISTIILGRQISDWSMKEETEEL